MNNMYDILAKMNLLEGRGTKPDFPDIDNDGNRAEPISKAAREVDEASYSAKATRAGKDIGKQKDMDESALQAYLGKKKYGEEGMKALQQAGRQGASKEKMAKIRAQHDKMDEADMGEGNDFTGARLAAIRAGKPTFKLDGKVYRVTGDTSDEKRMDEGYVDFMDKKAQYRGIGAEVEGRSDDYVVTFRDGSRKRYQELDGRRRVTTLEPVDAPEEQDAEGNVVKRGRGRPKGSKRSLGAKGPSGRSKLMRMEEDETGIRDDLAYEIEQILDGAIEGTDQTDHIIDELGDLYDRIESSGDKVALKAYSMMNGAIDQGTHAQVRAAQMALKRLKGDIKEDSTQQRKIVKKAGKPVGEVGIDHDAPSGRSGRYYMKHYASGTDLGGYDSFEEAMDELRYAMKQGMSEDYDRDEYDEEGEMAKSQARTIEDAAKELQDILDDDENLPEWVQKKITLAKEYIDSARDYMKANPDEEDIDVDVEVDDEELVAEKAVSKAQRAAAGIAYAARKGDIPKSELRGASKEMADMPSKELKKFAKTKEKGLPEKVKEEDKEEVDETTVAGSVATSTDTPKGKKGGMQFGKGVYESQIAESFERKLGMLTEGMNINMSMDENGKKSLTVSATDDDAEQLAAILKMAGLDSHPRTQTCEVCGGEGMHEAGCDRRDMVEEELANSPDPTYAELGDTRDYGVSGGLNGPKLQSNPNNMADNPLAMGRLASKGASGQLNLGAMAEDIEQKLENRLMDLYKRIS